MRCSGDPSPQTFWYASNDPKKKRPRETGKRVGHIGKLGLFSLSAQANKSVSGLRRFLGWWVRLCFRMEMDWVVIIFGAPLFDVAVFIRLLKKNPTSIALNRTDRAGFWDEQDEGENGTWNKTRLIGGCKMIYIYPLVWEDKWILFAFKFFLRSRMIFPTFSLHWM